MERIFTSSLLDFKVATVVTIAASTRIEEECTQRQMRGTFDRLLIHMVEDRTVEAMVVVWVYRLDLVWAAVCCSEVRLAEWEGSEEVACEKSETWAKLEATLGPVLDN